MKLALLGTNGYGPTEDGHTACFMIPEMGIVLDAGTGLFRIPDYLQTPNLDIYLTHAHLDHVLGLTYLWAALAKKQLQQTHNGLPDFETMEKGVNKLMERVRVLAAVDVLTGLEQRLGLWDDMQYVTLESEQPLPGNGTLKWFPLNHGIPCYGFRLDWPGHSLAYVTDTITSADAAYVEHLQGVDLLLHDAYAPDQWKPFADLTRHGFPSGAAEVAAKAGVKRLLLIHHNTIGLRVSEEELAAVRMIFPATEIGLDNMVVDF